MIDLFNTRALQQAGAELSKREQQIQSQTRRLVKLEEDHLQVQSVLSLFDQTQSIIEFGAEGRILRANDRMCALLGYTQSELQSMHYRQLMIDSVSQARHMKEAWERFAEGKPLSGQFGWLAKNGSHRWLEASFHPLLDAAGQLTKIVTLAVDITAAKIESMDHSGKLAAVDKSLAVIEFTLDGTILTANENFCKALGYQLQDVVGKHHRMFVDPAYAQSSDYRSFWEKLARGEFDRGQYCRLGKGGREVWIEASYNPVFDGDGRPVKVVKYASDITAAKLRAADFEGQLNAVNRSQAVIEFDLNGNILKANENFCQAVGYSDSEIVGRHHSLFVDREYQASAEYRAFWARLSAGEFESGQFRRVGKGGREIWIQATYNPILGPDGRPKKVVKYATDITASINASRALQAAVAETRQVVEATQARDLSKRIELAGKPEEIAVLCEGVNSLIDTMSAIIANIRESAATINVAASEISNGNSDLSRRTEEQASSLEETASAMEELTSTVKQNADNSRQANKLATSASAVAIEGGDVVRKVVATMGEIAGSAKKIENIIGVIDGIAFQTNILALNAAVEAARAGEQGRGFAVVASEVRNLAQRSAGAAKEIKELITDSVRRVDSGTQLAGAAGNTMGEVVRSVQRVADIISEISAASEEQSAGIEQVNQAIAQMDQTTQQNAALVEEAAAAAESLEEQTRGLTTAVEAYTISSSSVTRPAATQADRNATGGRNLRLAHVLSAA